MRDDVKAKARFYFSEKLQHYKESGDTSDFGKVIDSIVDMGFSAGIAEAEDWCSLHCDAETTSCSVHFRELLPPLN